MPGLFIYYEGAPKGTLLVETGGVELYHEHGLGVVLIATAVSARSHSMATA